MDTEPLHLVDPEEADAPHDLPPAPPGLLRCQECTILIGPGYLETESFAHPARPGGVCWRCFESLERRAHRHPPPMRAPPALGASARRSTG
jgi:hypothetical protein